MAAALPPGWEVFTNDDGIPYYHNAATGQTVWEPPTGPPAAAAHGYQPYGGKGAAQAAAAAPAGGKGGYGKGSAKGGPPVAAAGPPVPAAAAAGVVGFPVSAPAPAPAPRPSSSFQVSVAVNRGGGRTPCFFWKKQIMGHPKFRCTGGDNCRFLHVLFRCMDGDACAAQQQCPYLHMHELPLVPQQTLYECIPDGAQAGCPQRRAAPRPSKGEKGGGVPAGMPSAEQGGYGEYAGYSEEQY
eukprot:TRINITY_DN3623_c0_g1_i1.p3 TRINITY_DN3623_c0_g1~~TRINITY_DN3623_c0_g1_i1.p3  ORF type:complete len:241 (+),score=56.86 TRINITY_DN3623_c0_g1_i1:105-827(+)